MRRVSEHAGGAMAAILPPLTLRFWAVLLMALALVLAPAPVHAQPPERGGGGMSPVFPGADDPLLENFRLYLYYEADGYPPRIVPAVERLMDPPLNYFRLFPRREVVLITNLGATDGYVGIPDLERILKWKLVKVKVVLTPPGGLEEENFPGVKAKAALRLLSERGIPVHEITPEDPDPLPELVRRYDGVIFDLPTVGSRYHLHTRLLARLVGLMEELWEEGLRRKVLLVVDHPNPSGRHPEGLLLSGPVLPGDPPLECPPVFGVTLGELASYQMAGPPMRMVRVRVADLGFYGAGLPYRSYGLNFFPPDPELDEPAKVLNFPGLVLLSATNLSLGQGTPLYMKVVGAPWLDPERVISAIPVKAGFTLYPVSFIPRQGPYAGEKVRGIGIEPADDPDFYSPLRVSMELLSAVARVHRDRLRISPEFDLMVGVEGAAGLVRQGRVGELFDRFRRDKATRQWQRLVRMGFIIGYEGNGHFNGTPPGYYLGWRPRYLSGEGIYFNPPLTE